MLKHIEITNFALISSLTLDLDQGLNAFTGETGAGKSILLDAFSFLLGARANPLWIRNDCDRMSVSGHFEIRVRPPLLLLLHELSLLDEDNEAEFICDEMLYVHIWRELLRNGRGQARVNGMPISAAALRTLGSELLEMQGQKETLILTQARHHLGILDQFGNSEHQSTREHYKELYMRWQQLDRHYQQLLDEEREANRYQELWRSQCEEIEALELEVGEDDSLEARMQLLQGAQRIEESLVASLDNLIHDDDDQSSAGTLVFQAKRELDSLARYGEQFESWAEQLDSLYWQLDELGRDISTYLARMDADPDELEDLSGRLNDIRQLKRKYGSDIESILAYHLEIQGKLEALELREDELHAADSARQSILAELEMCGKQLSQQRLQTALLLKSVIEKSLDDLVMPECHFDVQFSSIGEDGIPHAQGLENCEFLIAPNPGEPPKPLARIASGGELARILLALKSALAAIDMPDIMVFDEPDAGLSGAAVRAMAVALAQLSSHCQLFLVTHQAVVAAASSHHYLIEKVIEDEQTYTHVHLLRSEERVQEMMRLLAADGSSRSARQHAEELLTEASRFRDGSFEQKQS